MSKALARQLTDRTENGLEDIQLQLKECKSCSSNTDLFFSPKKTKSRKKRKSNEVDNAGDEGLITNTQQPLNNKTSPEAMLQETVNSFKTTKTAISKETLRPSTLLNQGGGFVRPRKKKWKELKDVILAQKVNMLKEIFCSKIKRNNQYSPPVYYQYEKNTNSESIFESQGFQLKQNIEIIISILLIYNFVSSIFVLTISMAFPQVRQQTVIKTIQYIGVSLFAFQILLSFVTIKFSLGRKLETIKEISSDYIKHKFFIDFLNLLIIIAYLSTQIPVLGYFRLVALLKLQDCLERLEKLEIFFIENYYNEQYWSLFKVFLFNFCFAHMLAIILVAMANANQSSNWMVSKGLVEAPWFEKYIWSYYWGTTIMLTIGFGDITAVSYQEALCMIFVETISCMVLAYNINCVGSLIANIRSQDIEKSKNMKIFKKLSDKHGINESLSWKINNYIEEHTNIKKLFNIEEEVQFVSKLPLAFRTDYLKEANKSIFQRLFFFNNLMEKTLFALAEKIQMKITHPEELVMNTESNLDIFILKHGEIGFISRKINRKYNQHVFDRMKIQEGSSPFLLNTNFITKNRSTYSIKSLVYSVLYYLEYDKLISILSETHLDYELYCRERDKNKNIIDQFQVFPCEFCPQKHTKFTCPKLHFVPIQQQIIHRQIFKAKSNKNYRIVSFERIQLNKQSSLRRYLYNKDIYEEKSGKLIESPSKKFKREHCMFNQTNLSENFDQSFEQSDQGSKNSKELGNTIQFSKAQIKYLEDTAEILKVHINKVVAKEKGYDDVWLIELDKMKNYKDYFAENNAFHLTDKFSLQKRQKSKTSFRKTCKKINKAYTTSIDELFSLQKQKQKDKIRETSSNSDQKSDQQESQDQQ